MTPGGACAFTALDPFTQLAVDGEPADHVRRATALAANDPIDYSLAGDLGFAVREARRLGPAERAATAGE